MTVRRIWRSTRWLLPAVVALLLRGLLSFWPWAAEMVFARGVFRVTSALLSPTQYLPCSLTELLVVLAVPAGVVLIWCAVRRPRVRRGIAWVVSSLFALYMVMHGFGYARPPLNRLMNLPETERMTTAQLAALTARFGREAAAARALCEEDEEGCMRLSQTVAQTLKDGGAGYRVLAEDYPFLQGGVSRAKGVVLSHWWSYTGITGMYFPLLAEANVNVDVPHSELPVTIAHELAHTRGIAHEDECNFLAILACVSHPSHTWQYAGWLSAYIHLSQALYVADPDLWQEVTAAVTTPAVQRDLAQQRRYWNGFEGAVEDLSHTVNDVFIRANGDAEGVARYDEVTALLIAYYG